MDDNVLFLIGTIYGYMVAKASSWLFKKEPNYVEVLVDI